MSIVWRTVGKGKNKPVHAFDSDKGTTTLCGKYHNCDGPIVPAPADYRHGCKRCAEGVDQRNRYDQHMIETRQRAVVGSVDPPEKTGLPTITEAMGAVRDLVDLIDESGVVPPLPCLMNARALLARFKGKP